MCLFHEFGCSFIYQIPFNMCQGLGIVKEMLDETDPVAPHCKGLMLWGEESRKTM